MKTTTKTQSLEEFVDHPERRINRIFAVTTANPTGVEYRQNLESNGEAYCDCLELLCTYNLSPTDLLALNGAVEDDAWTWDGRGNVRDYAGNSFRKLQVFGGKST